MSLEVDSDTVVFDDELTPAQQYNLEKLLGRTAIDRTAVILDIFAQNASSQEGKAQVELALLRYRLPRLRGRGRSCPSRPAACAAGGARIGSRARRDPARGRPPPDPAADHQARGRARGDRPSPRHPAQVPAAQPARPRRHRRLHERRQEHPPQPAHRRRGAGRGPALRHPRRHHPTPRAARRRAGAGLRHRRVHPKLPHGLVEAFGSTLAVAADADLLAHLVDASAPDPVRADGRGPRRPRARSAPARCPSCWCFNKADRAPRPPPGSSTATPGSVAVSAWTGEGTDDLLRTVGDRLRSLTEVVELLIPYDRGDLLAAVHREGEVVSEAHTEGGVHVRARLDAAGKARLAEVVRSSPRPVASPAAMQPAILCYLESDGALALEAIAKLRTVAPTEVLPMPTVAHVLETVEHTPGSAGLLPIEDSYEGEALAVYDRLVFDSWHAFIRDEVVVSDSLDAFATPRGRQRAGAHRGVDAPRGSTTASASCRSTACGSATPTPHRRVPAGRRRRRPGSSPSPRPRRRLRSASSPWPSASRTCPTSRPASSWSAARWRRPPATTRRPSSSPRPSTGGHLVDLLEAFGENDVNMVSLLSRPLRASMGTHCFQITCEGHISEARRCGRRSGGSGTRGHGQGPRVVPGVDRRPGHDAVRLAAGELGRPDDSADEQAPPAPPPPDLAPMRVAFLGPEGTFAHQAVRPPRCCRATADRAEPRPTVVSVLEAVEDGEADLGVVPFENSVEGQVNLTVDVLVHDAERIQVCEEVVLDVTFGAYRRPGDATPAATVASHPVGLAQCRRWVHGSGLATRETSSTAEACRLVAEGGEPGLVAVASPAAAVRWGLEPIAEGSRTSPGPRPASSWSAARPPPPPAPTARCSSSTPPDDRAGVLLAAARAALGPGPQPLGHRQPAAAGPARRVLLPAHRRRPPRRPAGGRRLRRAPGRRLHRQGARRLPAVGAGDREGRRARPRAHRRLDRSGGARGDRLGHRPRRPGAGHRGPASTSRRPLHEADLVVVATPLDTLHLDLPAVLSAVAGRRADGHRRGVGEGAGARRRGRRPRLRARPPDGRHRAIGLGGAEPTLFVDAPWLVLVADGADVQRVGAVCRLALAVGARPVPIPRHPRPGARHGVAPAPRPGGGLTLQAENLLPLAAGSMHGAARVAAGAPACRRRWSSSTASGGGRDRPPRAHPRPVPGRRGPRPVVRERQGGVGPVPRAHDGAGGTRPSPRRPSERSGRSVATSPGSASRLLHCGGPRMTRLRPAAVPVRPARRAGGGGLGAAGWRRRPVDRHPVRSAAAGWWSTPWPAATPSGATRRRSAPPRYREAAAGG